MPQAGKDFSVALRSPEFGEKKAGGQCGDEEQQVEEEIDECVHAGEQNTGGRTFAGGGLDHEFKKSQVQELNKKLLRSDLLRSSAVVGSGQVVTEQASNFS